ncbi:MAG: DUF1295 domain-containing protein [Firmicutes bacterium]|nr:DUF1295 domain-containing protein [Bacillota bacterium]
MELLILFLISLICTSVGFQKLKYFTTLGMAYSIVGICLALMFLYLEQLTPKMILLCVGIIGHGLVLAAFLTIRENTNEKYVKVAKMEENDGRHTPFIVKQGMWIAYSVFYILLLSPLYFRLINKVSPDLGCMIGIGIMYVGILFEMISDFVKNDYKNYHPHHYCDVLMFKYMRFPNYIGEIVIWIGLYVSGFTAYQNIAQEILSFSVLCVVTYYMLCKMKELEKLQNARYRQREDYKEYVKNTPVLLPFTSTKTLVKWKWLQD